MGHILPGFWSAYRALCGNLCVEAPLRINLPFEFTSLSRFRLAN
jgi:hypothetical protein